MQVRPISCSIKGVDVPVVDEQVNPSASSALYVSVSVSEREMLRLSSPAPGTAGPNDFERKTLRHNWAEWRDDVRWLWCVLHMLCVLCVHIFDVTHIHVISLVYTMSPY